MREKRKCYISTCNSTDPSRSFHEFPAKQPAREQWFRKIFQSSEEPPDLPSRAVVCSLHFEDTCFKNSMNTARKLLKSDAIPTIFGRSLPYTSLSISADSSQPQSTVANWSIKQLRALIHECRKYPFLYFSNRRDRFREDIKSAYISFIVEKLQPIRPGTTESEVTEQWKILQTQYVETHNEFIEELAEGFEAEEPTVWYYKEMSFLRDFYYSNSELVQVESESAVAEGFNACNTTPCDSPTPSETISVKEENLNFDSPAPKKLKSDSADVSCDEDFDVEQYRNTTDKFAKFVAAQLQKIVDDDVRHDTMLEIHQILYKAVKMK